MFETGIRKEFVRIGRYKQSGNKYLFTHRNKEGYYWAEECIEDPSFRGAWYRSSCIEFI